MDVRIKDNEKKTVTVESEEMDTTDPMDMMEEDHKHFVDRLMFIYDICPSKATKALQMLNDYIIKDKNDNCKC